MIGCPTVATMITKYIQENLAQDPGTDLDQGHKVQEDIQRKDNPVQEVQEGTRKRRNIAARVQKLTGNN